MGIANIINNSTTTSGGEIVRELVNSSDGAGLHFDGAAGQVNATATELPAPYSFECVFTAKNASSANSVLMGNTHSGTARRVVGIVAGEIRFSYYEGSWVSVSGGSIESDTVYHVVATRDSSNVQKVYVNGNDVTSGTAGLYHSTARTLGWSGGTGDPRYFNGTIYRARFYNKALSSAEVQTAYERADVDFADQYGSQTEKITAWTNNSSYPYETFTSSGTTISSAINTSGYGIAYSAITLEVGKKYRITYDITLNSGTRPKIRVGSASTSLGTAGVVLDTDATGSHEFTATSSSTNYAGFWTDDGDANNWSVANFSFVQIGCVSDYDLAFANPTQSLTVQDRSGAADGTCSASGVTQVQPVVQLNSTSARIGTTAATPADGDIIADKVGAGIAPAATLHAKVAATTASSPLEVARLEVEDNGSGVNMNAGIGPKLSFYSPRNTASIEGASIAAKKESGTDDSEATSLVFSTCPAAGTNTERLTIDSTGNVTANVGTYLKLSRDNSYPRLELYRNDASIGIGNTVGDINFGGADANNNAAARIRARADAHWTANSSATAFDFQTCPDGSESPATCLTIASTGLATFSGGINLGNTVSATATTLDGYEEGTFEVTNNGDTSGVLSSETGEYTRIGNCVFIRVVIRVGTTFTSNRIAGLPFGCVTDGGTSSWSPIGTALTSAATNAPILVAAQNGVANLSFFKQANATTPHYPSSTSEDYYRISGYYYTTDAF